MALDLNDFWTVRAVVLNLRQNWLQWRHGAIIDRTSTVSTSATLVGGGKGDIRIGAETLVALKCLIIARDTFGTAKRITIGRRCFIGGGSIIMPGVTIGNEVIVGAGSVVFDDVPDRCAVAGNPARIVKRDIEVGRYGRLSYATLNMRKNEI
ncbi:DapH/DapD/GlmU-related protein [Novosphingobium sp. CECT 9465]|uniref:DapH/DapD/GlmU-related protein n=1 Tax=Novosphingobium sp. CECT 9465 TaxID=2829794 RepID=UPI001E2F62F3|nr:DapH/DapD/GlmU-related protein [Novosphingobium sp. CECT 9465]CAH0497937.1 2,3,4,5-tetrahydropyridine-2,6-dicarboxylate N-acetyltransferase [Novosphingobium sp. CECT 9465]